MLQEANEAILYFNAQGTPPDKAAGLLHYVDSVRTVVRKNNHAFVIEIDKAQMMQELEVA